MATVPLVLEKLSKRYPGAKEYALHEVSLQVASGEIYGFLGANGAGKSTAIRTLLNFLQPTSGTATILGKDIVHDSVSIMHEVGYLAGDVALYDKLTGQQFLDYMAALHPLPEPTYMKHLNHEFQTELSKPIRSLSKGNRQKLGIVQAFMHKPNILILDEPTSGLDPLMQEAFFDTVREAKQRGASVFFSSHNLAEVQRICDRVGFIRKGKLIREQSLAELASNASHIFDVTFIEPAPLHELRQIPHTVVERGRDENHITISVPAASFAQFFGVLSDHPLQQFQQREVNLEEEFMSYYREDAQ